MAVRVADGRLWTSDDNAFGTQRVCTVNSPSELASCGGDPYFGAYERLIVLAPLAPPSWSVAIGVPNDPALDGYALPVQAWWVAPNLTVATTRALLLGLGR